MVASRVRGDYELEIRGLEAMGEYEPPALPAIGQAQSTLPLSSFFPLLLKNPLGLLPCFFKLLNEPINVIVDLSLLYELRSEKLPLLPVYDFVGAYSDPDIGAGEIKREWLWVRTYGI